MNGRNNIRNWREQRNRLWQRKRASRYLLMLSILLASIPVNAFERGGSRLATRAGIQDLTGHPEISMQKPDIEFRQGTTFELEFRVGSANVPVQSLFGISFELHYTSDQFIEFVPPGEALAGEFLRPDVYTFTRHEASNRVVYLAVSRKRGAKGQSGFGVILKMPLKIADNAPEGWQICFKISNVTANDSVGQRLAIEPGPSVCLKVFEPRIEVIPNPFTPNGDGYNDQVRFKRERGIPDPWVILIMDRSGRVIRRLTHREDTWDGRDVQGRLMLPGVYLYTIRNGKQIIKRGLIGIIR